LLNRTWESWNSHNTSRIGAALAFYTLLSLAPLVVLSIAAGALLFGGTSAEQRLVHQVGQLVGNDGARLVRSLAEQAQRPGPGTTASAIGLATLLFGASGIFTELRSALNTIWDIPPKEQNQVLGWIRERLLSIGMVVAIGFLLVVSLVVSTALAIFGKFFGELLPVPAPLLEATNFVISYIGIAIMFALIFRYASDARIPWREAWESSAITSLFFTIGKMLIGLYLGRTAVGSAYGASGSLVGVVVWVYYSAQIFLFGAEFTRILSQA
jgi:membrane protein